MRRRKRRPPGVLKAVLHFAPLALLALAIVLWALLPGHDEHEQERQGISEALDDYYKKN